MNKLLASFLFLCLFAFVSSQDFTRFLGLRNLQDVTLTDEYSGGDNGETEESLEEGWLEEELLLEEGGAEEEESNVWEDANSRLLSFRVLEEVTDEYAGENGEAEAPVEEGELEEEYLLEEGDAEEDYLWDDVNSRLLGFRNLGEVANEYVEENGETEESLEEGWLEEECLLEEEGAEEETNVWEEDADVDSRLLSFRALEEVTDEYAGENGEAEAPVEEGEVEEEQLLEEGGAEEEDYLWDDLNSRLLGFRNLGEVNYETEEDSGETEAPVEEGELEEEYLLEEGGVEEEGYLWRDDNLVL